MTKLQEAINYFKRYSNISGFDWIFTDHCSQQSQNMVETILNELVKYQILLVHPMTEIPENTQNTITLIDCENKLRESVYRYESENDGQFLIYNHHGYLIPVDYPSSFKGWIDFNELGIENDQTPRKD